LWLKDAALFDVIEKIPELRGIDWWDWPVGLRDREKSELLQVSKNIHISWMNSVLFNSFGTDNGFH